jgi:membrane-bound metal-dependent hydrolase YbcI (DUF457 family)
LPSPVGHSLAALTLHQIARRSGSGLSGTASAIALVVAANAADLDFLPGVLLGVRPDLFHHDAFHSLLAAVLCGLGAGFFARAFGSPYGFRWGWLTAVAYASHLLLDMLATLGRPMYGVPLYWPVSDVRQNLPLDLFLDITRDPSADGFVQSLLTAHNWEAVVRELVVLGGVLAFVVVIDRRTRPRDPSRLRKAAGPGAVG